MKEITLYVCEGCGAEFRKKSHCKEHIIVCQRCPECVHAYYVYGCELNCELKNNGKRCNFKKKEQGK